MFSSDNLGMREKSIILGLAHHRYRPGLEFGISERDRLLHMLAIGQTGTGKTTLIANMAKQDAEQGRGFCVIDPHGDLAKALSQNLGAHHTYWDIGDVDSPYGYNPLTRTSPEYRPLVTSGLIETLKAQWHDAWGARMEHLLRFAILALLEQPRADLRDVVPLFVERSFRDQVISQVTDPQVLRFWREEFRAMNYKTSMDGVAPIANKIGAFLANPTVRRAICKPKKPLRFRKLMDEGRVVIVNLAKGRIGSDVANVLGGLLVSSIMNAAFSRHELKESARRSFFLYVDEYPSFSTLAFANMLSEARKYGIGIILANQHVSQTDPDLLHAVIGNVGSMVIFRLGALDTPLFVNQLDETTAQDLVRLPNHNAFVQLMINGRKSRTFSARTFPAFYS